MNKTTRTALNIALTIVILISSSVARPATTTTIARTAITTHEGI